MAEEQEKQLLLNISLSEKEVTDLSKKDKRAKEVKSLLLEILKIAEVEKCDRTMGTLFFSSAQQFQKTQIDKKYIQLVVDGIKSKKIPAIPRLDLAFQFLKKLEKDQEIDIPAFEDFIGVGIVVEEADIRKAIDEMFKERAEELKTLRYGINQVNYRADLEKKLRFPNKKDLFNIFNEKMEALLGKETAEEKQARMQKARKDESAKSKPKKEAPKKDEKGAPAQQQTHKLELDINNLVARDLKSAVNTKETNEWKQKNFGDILLSRFPPEPNGYLHLGHCKAINFNFSLAEQYKGGCYLRFDDTNPDKENMEFINSIKNNISWLGFKPYKVTCSSDNFDYLYECAVKLIKKGKAFVCGQNKDQMKASREANQPSPFRDQTVEENLRLFNNMKLGLYKEGQYSLRAKIDYTSPNTTLKDPVIYRIRYTPHPHSGDKWCIYPLYDFTHPICDSLEGITHSCCTLEFEIRRELYYWVLDELDIYRPYVWEYSRLNISHNVLSKRKLQQLIEEKYVNGWDDPRLLTIDGMKRRGYPAQGLLNFVSSLGVNRTSNDAVVGMDYLENKIRDELDSTAIRTLAVLEPVQVTIKNMKDGEVRVLEVPDLPRDPNSKKHKVEGRNKVYIERSDVIHMAHKDFFGAAPGTYFGLKYFGAFLCTEVQRDEQGNITEVFAEYAHDGTDKTRKPKAFLNWVSVEESQECEVRLYDNLFNYEFPTKYEKGPFTDTINPENLKIIKNARMNSKLNLQHLDKYQFERQGFFAVDYDSDVKANRIVWNRTVKLIEKDRIGALKKVLEDIAKIEAEQKK